MIINWKIIGEQCGTRTGSSPVKVETWSDVAHMLVNTEPQGWVSAWATDNNGNELEYFGGHAIEAPNWFPNY